MGFSHKEACINRIMKKRQYERVGGRRAKEKGKGAGDRASMTNASKTHLGNGIYCIK